MKEMPIAISLDFRKSRIRIHKKTLKMLDFPHTIVMYMNPSDAVIAIIRQPGFKKDAIKLTYDADGDCEVYSEKLMNMLAYWVKDCNKEYTYRVSGEMYGRDAAYFALANAKPLIYGEDEANGK